MMSYAEAVTLLAELSGMPKAEVVRVPTDALWQASARLVEARDVIADEKRKNHPSERGDL